MIADRPARTFPNGPLDQLWGAIAAVFESWNTRRAIDYRKLHDIPDSMGTAVNIVTMVFGNLGEDSGTGVAFTRDPSTGEPPCTANTCSTPRARTWSAAPATPSRSRSSRETLPQAFAELERVARTLERHFRDVQDMEFTIERGKLYMLQTRRGQRIGPCRGADRLRDGGRGADHRGRGGRPDPAQRPQPAAPPHHRPEGQLDLLTTGLPASPGAASRHRGVRRRPWPRSSGSRARPVILVRRETSPEDFHGMVAAKAILTARGGMTSHAAVVARGMGKPCVAGRPGDSRWTRRRALLGRTAARSRGRVDHGRRRAPDGSLPARRRS